MYCVFNAGVVVNGHYAPCRSGPLKSSELGLYEPLLKTRPPFAHLDILHSSWLTKTHLLYCQEIVLATTCANARISGCNGFQAFGGQNEAQRRNTRSWMLDMNMKTPGIVTTKLDSPYCSSSHASPTPRFSSSLQVVPSSSGVSQFHHGHCNCSDKGRCQLLLCCDPPL